MIKDEYLSPAEVSRLLKVSKPWPYTMAARGLIPHYKMGSTEKKKLIRFRLSDLEEFMERSRVEKK